MDDFKITDSQKINTNYSNPIPKKENTSPPVVAEAQKVESVPAVKLTKTKSIKAKGKPASEKIAERMGAKFNTSAARQKNWDGQHQGVQLNAVTDMIRENVYFCPKGAEAHSVRGQRLAVSEDDGRFYVENPRFKFFRKMMGDNQELGGTEAATSGSSSYIPIVSSLPGGSFIAKFIMTTLGIGVLKDFVTRIYVNQATMFTLGEGKQRVKLEKMMEKERAPEAPKPKLGIIASIKRTWNHANVGISGQNRRLALSYKPKAVFEGFTRILKVQSKENPVLPNDTTLRSAESYLPCTDETKKKNISQMVTFGGWMMRAHALRRAEKATGGYGAIAHMLTPWKRSENYGASKADSSLNKDEPTITAFNDFMHQAAIEMGIETELSDGLNVNLGSNWTELNEARLKYIEKGQKINSRLDKNTNPNKEDIEEFSQHANKLGEHQQEVAKAMLQVHEWTRDRIENPKKKITQEELNKLRALRDTVHIRLGEFATDKKAEWSQRAQNYGTTNTNQVEGYSFKLGHDGLEFLSDPFVKEMVALLEMTEGAIQLGEAKLDPSHPLNEVLNNFDYFPVMKLERVYNFGQKVYSEMDKHFQIWIFNAYISPTLTTLEQFSEYVSVEGIYGFGPVQPDPHIISRYPLLTCCVKSEMLTNSEFDKAATDPTEETFTERIVQANSLKDGPENNKYQAQYRFMACFENDAGHKSYILDPVKNDGTNDLSKNGLYVGLGTQFDQELYTYRQRPTRSGVRTDLQTDIARDVANQTVVDKDGKKMSAAVAVGNYMRSSPHQYSCMGHSLGAATIDGVVTAEGFPVGKLDFIGSYSSPGINKGDNLHFYESVTKNMIEDKIPLNYLKNKVFPESYKNLTPEQQQVFDRLVLKQLKSAHYSLLVFVSTYQDLGNFGLSEEMVDAISPVMFEFCKNKANFQDNQWGEILKLVNLQNGVEYKVNDPEQARLDRGEALDLYLSRYKEQIRPPRVLTSTTRFDLVGHVGTTRYNLGLTNAHHKRHYAGVLRETSVIVGEFTTATGNLNIRAHHTFQIYQEKKGSDWNNVRFYKVDEMSYTRRTVKYIVRGGWQALGPIRKVASFAIKNTTESYRKTYGYGTVHAKHGTAQLRNRATILPRS